MLRYKPPQSAENQVEEWRRKGSPGRESGRYESLLLAGDRAVKEGEWCWSAGKAEEHTSQGQVGPCESQENSFFILKIMGLGSQRWEDRWDWRQENRIVQAIRWEIQIGSRL